MVIGLLYDEVKDIANKYYGYEGVVLDEIAEMLNAWEEYRAGKCDWECVEQMIAKIKDTLMVH